MSNKKYLNVINDGALEEVATTENPAAEKRSLESLQRDEARIDFDAYYYLDEDHLLRHVDLDGVNFYVIYDDPHVVLFQDTDIKICRTEEEYRLHLAESTNESVCITTFNMLDKTKQYLIELRDRLNGGQHH